MNGVRGTHIGGMEVSGPASAVRVGNGVAEHCGSMSAMLRPAGRKGSRTVPAELGMMSEQSVSALWS